MSKTIWKFQLETTDLQTVRMPKGAEILTLQVQTGRPCIWALVDPEAEREGVNFVIYGTGHPEVVTRMKDYVGTYMIRDGALVFHVFIYP